MFTKINRKRAFTLIELIVVIAVIGILILLAAPKFLGYTKEAKLAQIKNDVRAHEDFIVAQLVTDNEFIASWVSIEPDTLETLRDNNSLLDKKGFVEGDYVLDGEYYSVPEGLINTKLKGDFYLASGGKIYYHEKGLKSGDNDSNGNDNESSDDIEMLPTIKASIGNSGGVSTPHNVKYEQEFKYNFILNMPGNLSGYKNLEIIDELESDLTFVDAKVFIDGAESNEYEVKQDGGIISLQIEEIRKKKLEGKEIKLEISTYIHKGSTRGKQISNKAKVIINDEEEVDSNNVRVRIREFSSIQSELVLGDNIEETSYNNYIIKNLRDNFEVKTEFRFSDDFANIESLIIKDELRYFDAVDVKLTLIDGSDEIDLSNAVQVNNGTVIATFDNPSQLEMLSNNKATMTITAKLNKSYLYRNDGGSYGYGRMEYRYNKTIEENATGRKNSYDTSHITLNRPEGLISDNKISGETNYYMENLNEEFIIDTKFTNKNLDRFDFDNNIPIALNVIDYKLTLDGQDVTDKVFVRLNNHTIYFGSYQVTSSKFNDIDLKDKEFHLSIKVKVKDEYRDFTTIRNSLSINGSGPNNTITIYPPK